MSKKQDGKRLKRLRIDAGLSTDELASVLGITEGTVRHWESGRTSWGPDRDSELCKALKIRRFELYSDLDVDTAEVVDTIEDLGSVLEELIQGTNKFICNSRLSMPYVQPGRVQTNFRKIISERLLEGSLTVYQVEIVHSIERLKEIAYNLRLYEEVGYHLKLFASSTPVVPHINVWSFDHNEFIVGGHHQHVPPVGVPNLRVKGRAHATYLKHFWDTLWQYSEPLTDSSNPEASINSLARSLGADSNLTRDVIDAADAKLEIPPRI